MRRNARNLVGVFGAMALIVALSAAFAASSASAIGIGTWEAGTCNVATCAYGSPSTYYSQAAGHPQDGVTNFSVNVEGGTRPNG